MVISVSYLLPSNTASVGPPRPLALLFVNCGSTTTTSQYRRVRGCYWFASAAAAAEASSSSIIKLSFIALHLRAPFRYSVPPLLLHRVPSSLRVLHRLLLGSAAVSTSCRSIGPSPALPSLTPLFLLFVVMLPMLGACIVVVDACVVRGERCASLDESGVMTFLQLRLRIACWADLVAVP